MTRFSLASRGSRHGLVPAAPRWFRQLAVLALGGTLLAGCAAQPGADLPPYGDSVRHMKEQQTYNPGDEVTPLSGDKAAEAMRAYRLPAGGARQGGMSPALP
ncbi:hypothetical protein [Litchfieldella rifensis]|uniref:Uncharacterized protein n=1 Tax=Litchfieldella rifensis TaxID=762643 RepID=A0ABV7LM74_9GAMM